eukprot:6172926-Pleurochrysis_carterae.AAC.1
MGHEDGRATNTAPASGPMLHERQASKREQGECGSSITLACFVSRCCSARSRAFSASHFCMSRPSAISAILWTSIRRAASCARRGCCCTARPASNMLI